MIRYTEATTATKVVQPEIGLGIRRLPTVWDAVLYNCWSCVVAEVARLWLISRRAQTLASSATGSQP
jgi:hypothetical protein